MTRRAVRAAMKAMALATMLACAGRARVPAPTTGHQPEPVAPVMTPTPAAPTAREIVIRLADSALDAATWRNARWGVLIVDLTTGDTVYSRDADRLFVPASNQKLFTGAIALKVLGPEYRWRTPVLLSGTQAGAVFRGNLVLVGSGDPSVSDAMVTGGALLAFDPIVAALEARGIRRIVGGVVTEGDAFLGPSTEFGWEVDDLDTPSGAAVDELLLNEGLLRVMVRGGGVAGAAVRVETSPTLSYPPVRVEAVTRAATDTGPRLDVLYDSVASVLRVTGSIAAGDSTRLSTSYRHPNDAYRAAVMEHLRARGIRLDAPKVLARAPSRSAKRSAVRVQLTPVIIDTLVVLESGPLQMVLPRMLKPSQNQIAELLFRTAGVVATGTGRVDSARAVAMRVVAEWGINPEQLTYRDGSGLSRHDYASPRAIVQLLDAMHRSPWATLFRQSLPLAGTDGTIANRLRNTEAAGNAGAKTGTLDKTRALSGYVTSADGHVMVFALLANNFTVSSREVDRVQDALVRALASMRFGAGAR